MRERNILPLKILTFSALVERGLVQIPTRTITAESKFYREREREGKDEASLELPGLGRAWT